MRLLASALIAVALLVPSRPAGAQIRGEDLTVSVITFGPHEHPFFKFGHNAVLIEHSSGQGFVYNFGMFDFSSPALIPKFALGRSMYWLARTPRDATIAGYVEENRTVEVQELDLSPEQRKAVFDRLEENARPQNRYYLYDYFFDNCSTRVRDVVDTAVGGRLRQAASAPARLSFRGHGLRLTADLPWEYLALSFGLGTTADRPVTRFEEGFIPMELRDLLRDVKLPAADGTVRPLVKSERTIFRASRVDPPWRSRAAGPASRARRCWAWWAVSWACWGCCWCSCGWPPTTGRRTPTPTSCRRCRWRWRSRSSPWGWPGGAPGRCSGPGSWRPERRRCPSWACCCGWWG
jgi:hypothetical protein